MSNTHDPADSRQPRGQHRLGPHVVGQRIVVRRLVRGETGMSGGPAMTDVLGTCLAWTDAECIVQPREGDPVRVPVADIVTGKPVPAKPSVRMRVTTAEAEAHTASLFPDVETAALGHWTLRWQQPAPAGRLRRRANSCLAASDPGVALGEALDAVTEHYTARDRQPLVQVERGSDLAAAIEEAGWAPVPGGDADFLLTSAALLRRELRGVEGNGVLREDDGRVQVSARATTGSTTARARAAVDGDWLGVHDVYVEPDHRRRGLATELLAELLEWGAERGARTVWLHVETDNTAALALYEGLGFIRHHTCGYLAQPS